MGEEQGFFLDLGHVTKPGTGNSRPQEDQGSAVSTGSAWAACDLCALAHFVFNLLIPGANGSGVFPELLAVF